MANSDYAEFVTSLPNIATDVFSKHQLKCIEVLGLIGLANNAAVTGAGSITEYSADIGSANPPQLIKDARAVLGQVPADQLQACMCRSLTKRNNPSATTNVLIMPYIKILQNYSAEDVERCRVFLLSVIANGLQV